MATVTVTVTMTEADAAHGCRSAPSASVCAIPEAASGRTHEEDDVAEDASDRTATEQRPVGASAHESTAASSDAAIVQLAVAAGRIAAPPSGASRPPSRLGARGRRAALGEVLAVARRLPRASWRLVRFARAR